MNIPISTGAYLAEARRQTDADAVMRNKANDWLPDIVIDAHTHCGLAEHVGEIPERLLRHMMTTFPWFTLEESKSYDDFLFPGRIVRRLRFAHAFQGIHHRHANTYLLGKTGLMDRVALYGIPDDIDYTCQMLSDPRVSALKMYHWYSDPPAKRISEFFPLEVLEEAQAQDIPIILHPPAMIVECEDQLDDLFQAFRDLKVVIAHLGLPHLPVSGLWETYVRISRHDNAFMDTANIPSEEVTAMAIRAFGPGRILYGSDEPINLIRAKVYEHPELGQRLATPVPYHWADLEEQCMYGHLGADAALSHWQTLSAVFEAIKKTTPRCQRDRVIESICRRNAENVFRF